MSEQLFRWKFVVGDDCSPDGEDACAMYPDKEGPWIKYVDVVEQLAAAEERAQALQQTVDGLSVRLCANHCATMAGDRLRRNDGACEVCALEQRAQEAETERERLEVVLSGVTGAATGCGLEGVRECVDKRQWAFHAALKDVLELRDKYEAAEEKLKAIRQPKVYTGKCYALLDLPEVCPDCDSREFVTFGSKGMICYRCSLLQANEELEEKLKAMQRPISVGEWGNAGRRQTHVNGLERANFILAARAGEPQEVKS